MCEGHRGELGKTQYMKVPIFTSKYCIYSTQVCTAFWVWGVIGTSVECIYGVSCICVSVCMHIFGWSSIPHFGLQGGVQVHGKSQIYSTYNLKVGLNCI